MSRLIVRPGAPLRGRVHVPGDKSISHRALLLTALAQGASRVGGFLPAGDCLATLACVRAMGIKVKTRYVATLTVHGRGLHGWRAPDAPLDCARSATTLRLLAGILAGQSRAANKALLTGEPQLLRRPMRRIVEPLRQMGAAIESRDGHAPLTIQGRPLHGCEYTLPIASAQVKSALLLAGLYADGPTIIHQPGPARDHTERMLAALGADVEVDGLTVALSPPASPLSPFSFSIPGDISSAAFLLVAAALVSDSEIQIADVGVNPTRTGLLEVLRAMGGRVVLENEREREGEAVADLTVRASELTGVEVGGDTVVRMIDEFPALAVAATQARGATIVRDAAELRVKESDRIAAIVAGLRALGARIDSQPDGFIIQGPTPLRGAVVDSHGDHRLAMALAVAGLIAEGEVQVENVECIKDSFPSFVDVMREVGAALSIQRGRE